MRKTADIVILEGASIDDGRKRRETLTLYGCGADAGIVLHTSQGTEHVRRPVRPFSAANSLRASAVSTLTMGTALAIAPDFSLALVGAGGSAGDPWMRATGGSLIALAIVFTAASRWPASMMQRPVMLAAALVATVAAAAWFLTLAAVTTPTWPIPVAIEGLLAAWLWWLLIADRV